MCFCNYTGVCLQQRSYWRRSLYNFTRGNHWPCARSASCARSTSRWAALGIVQRSCGAARKGGKRSGIKGRGGYVHVCAFACACVCSCVCVPSSSLRGFWTRPKKRLQIRKIEDTINVMKNVWVHTCVDAGEYCLCVCTFRCDYCVCVNGFFSLSGKS